MNEINVEVPWSNDLLDRQKVAKYLTEYLQNRYHIKPLERGFVLALTADWGFGKTYLLENWAAELTADGYPVVTFDAWANDFTPEPLIAFVAQIDKAMRPIVQNVPTALRLLDAAIHKAKILWKPTANVLLQVAAKKLTGCTIDQLQRLFDAEESATEPVDNKAELNDIASSLRQVYDVALRDHTDKQSAIQGFKECLNLLVDQLNTATNLKLPLFIFVDELDRCRPSYAIELLEGIKHLFGVPGVYFVVALNARQLGEATKSVYGSNFEGHRYLKRFFDIQFSLPEPDHAQFCSALFAESTLPPEEKFFTGFNEHNVDGEVISRITLFSSYARFFGLGLRDQQQVMRVLEGACNNLHVIHAHWMFFLAMLSQQNAEVFEKIRTTDGNLGDSAVRAELQAIQRNTVIIETLDLAGESYPDRPPKRHTDLQEVITLYYTHAYKDLKQLGGGFNNIEFPENILSTLRGELPRSISRNKSYFPSIRKYAELISYAGNFSM